MTMINHKGTVTLESSRLILRKFQLNDAYDMYKNWASKAIVTKNLTWKPHNNIERTKFIIRNWIQNYKNID